MFIRREANVGGQILNKVVFILLYSWRCKMESVFKRGFLTSCRFFLLLTIATFMMVCGLSDISLAQNRLDIPTANLEIENKVPLHLIKKIAKVKAEEVFGKGALGEPIPLSDPNGDIYAYMFSLYIGGDRFLAYNEIHQKIIRGRELRNLVKNSQIEKAKEIYKKRLIQKRF